MNRSMRERGCSCIINYPRFYNNFFLRGNRSMRVTRGIRSGTAFRLRECITTGKRHVCLQWYYIIGWLWNVNGDDYSWDALKFDKRSRTVIYPKWLDCESSVNNSFLRLIILPAQTLPCHLIELIMWFICVIN